jgi:hypothetical protein
MSVQVFSEHSPLERLNALGLTLPSPARPIGHFRNFKRSGNFLYVSG